MVIHCILVAEFHGGQANNSQKCKPERQQEDSEESGVGHEEEEEIQQLIIELLSNISTPKVSEVSATSALLKWGPPAKDAADPKFEALDHINEDSDFQYEVSFNWLRLDVDI